MGRYWKQEQNNLILEINSTTGSTKERAIGKLYPALTMMAEAILNRYFRGSFNPWEYDIICTEAIQKVLMKLHLFNPDRAKAFSYCQTIIRNQYITKLVRPSQKEAAWKQCVNEDPNIIADDVNTNYSYEDHNIEREIISTNDLILNRLYEIKKDVDESAYIMGCRAYERLKLDLPKPKYGFKVDGLKKMIDCMIDIIEETPDLEYERFIIELYKRTKIGHLTMGTYFGYVGMNFPDVKKIIHNYNGYRENEHPQKVTGVLQNMEKDNTTKEMANSSMYGRKYYKKKRDEKYNEKNGSN